MQGTPEHQPGRARTRGVVIAVVTAVVAAVVAGLVIFSGGGDSATAGQQTGTASGGTAQTGAAQTGTAQTGTAQGAGQGKESSEDLGRTPGSVRLPEGGKAKLVAEEVGADGALPIPQSLGEAAWWGSGLGAGKGVTLLSGHVNWAGKTGPFEQLWRMKPGQLVTVTDTAGKAWQYKIDEARTIHKTDLAAESAKLFDPDGPHRLVLVTCGGDYVGGQEGYDDNRVVTASPVTRS